MEMEMKTKGMAAEPYDLTNFETAELQKLCRAENASKCFKPLCRANIMSRTKWLAQNQEKRNVLHIAATNLKPKSVQWLLNYKNNNDDLSTARNLQGYTPLEDLQDFLETNRTTRQLMMRKVCVSDSFTGHAIEAVRCLAYLQDLKDPTKDQINRLMHGCTCEQCIDGIISPRMKLALLCQAELSYDLLCDDIDEHGPLWTMVQEDLHVHVAPDIRRNFKTNKSLRKGFRNLFDFTAQVLRDNQVPSINNGLCIILFHLEHFTRS